MKLNKMENTKTYFEKLNTDDSYKDMVEISPFDKTKRLKDVGMDKLINCIYEDIKDIVNPEITEYFNLIRRNVRPKEKFKTLLVDIMNHINNYAVGFRIYNYSVEWSLNKKFRDVFLETYNSLIDKDVISFTDVLNHIKVSNFSIPYGYPRTIEQNMNARVLSCFIIPEFKCGYVILKTRRKIIACEITTCSDGYGYTTKVKPMDLEVAKNNIDNHTKNNLNLLILDEEEETIAKQIKRESNKKILKAL